MMIICSIRILYFTKNKDLPFFANNGRIVIHTFRTLMVLRNLERHIGLFETIVAQDFNLPVLVIGRRRVRLQEIVNLRRKNPAMLHTDDRP